MWDVGRSGLAIFAASALLFWLFLIILADVGRRDRSLSDSAATAIPSSVGGSESSFGGTSELDLIFDALDGGF